MNINPWKWDPRKWPAHTNPDHWTNSTAFAVWFIALVLWVLVLIDWVLNR